MTPHRRAFTLVELLVCVAIIALLIGLMLPTISHARDSARSTRCIAGLRDTGQAVAAYMADHKLRYPAGWDDIGGDPEPCPVVGVYVWIDPDDGGRSLTTTAIEMRPWDICRDGFSRHGLRRGEEMLNDPNSAQWVQSWRNWLRLDGSVTARRGPLSDGIDYRGA